MNPVTDGSVWEVLGFEQRRMPGASLKSRLSVQILSCCYAPLNLQDKIWNGTSGFKVSLIPTR